MAYTWTELLDDVKVRGMIPTSQSTYTAARLLALANAVMRSKIVPAVNKVRENYYSYDVDFTASAGPFDIPTRAVGGKLENACFINGTTRYDATRYWEEDLTDTAQAPFTKLGFYIKRNKIYVLPSSGGGFTTFRVGIIMRPNELVAQTSAAQVSSINTGTRVVTCTTVPSTWTTSDTYDMVDDDPHFDWLAIDQAISAITTGSSGTLTFSSALPSSLAVGDWIGLAQQTPVIQCPVEFHPLLAQEIANVCLKSQGDKTGYELGLAEVKMLREELVSLISPRVEQEGKTLVNTTGILRRGL